ncbi:radical SAM domain-containing protein [Oscillochloris trichoides DG-6]|uniref:Radical SAM domain-containing protein n=1 Tax=Oscillochloris trichoides DG-6 TaxID=765420 RepID=E1IEQ1_9CHLR|nr:radical SAM protein [Oscillochloris trichoides]EFO80343.1 radical SAM domain-containing protein [Oscillochloris trichoides DG-6]
MSTPLAELLTPSDDGAFHCAACQWRCVLRPGETGRCLVRVATEEGISLLGYGMISGATICPVEDHRLWHFFPDTMMLSIGSWGYASTVDQQRGPYATIPEDPAKQRRLDAERAANFALERLCRGVVWAYGEPAVAHEYVLALLQLSRASSRVTALLTTGVITPEALEELGPYLDAISFDLRGFSDASYARLGGLPNWRDTLTLIAEAHNRWHCHIEVTTRIHHGVNDSPDELRELVEWITTTLGPYTPWHVLPGDAGSATASSVVRARRIGHENGLHYIYTSEASQTTRCPACQATLITRTNETVRIVGMKDGLCETCGHDPQLQLSIFKARTSS